MVLLHKMVKSPWCTVMVLYIPKCFLDSSLTRNGEITLVYCDGSLHTQNIYLDSSLTRNGEITLVYCDGSLHTQNIYLDSSLTRNGEITLPFTGVL